MDGHRQSCKCGRTAGKVRSTKGRIIKYGEFQITLARMYSTSSEEACPSKFLMFVSLIDLATKHLQPN